MVAMSACTAPEESVAPAPADAAGDDLRELLRVTYGSVDPDLHTFEGRADLNGDGRDEVIVHVAGPVLCGTGGCTTLVFTPRGEGYRLLAEIAPTRPPIQVSANETEGWRNLLVRVSGGGLQASYDAELRFDGESYPANPTDPGVLPAADAAGAEVLIAPFEDYREGTPLAGPSD